MTERVREHLSPDTLGWTWALLRAYPSEDRDALVASGRAWTKRGALRQMRRAKEAMS